MRKIGIIFILVLFGMSLWKAYDRKQPVSSDPAVSHQSPLVVGAASAMTIDIPSKPVSVEEASPQADEPDQPGLTLEPVVEESSVVAVKQRQKLKPAVQSGKSFDQVVIPTLKVKASVVSKPYSELSWNLTALGQDVALLGNIPTQTSENNVVIAGHVTVRNGSHGPFRYLWKLVPGDQILLEEDNITYTYTVREQVLVYPDETSVLEDSRTPQLTLITCTTWDEETLSYLRRRVIVADLESVEIEQLLLD